jgi:hypothetical protein
MRFLIQPFLVFLALAAVGLLQLPMHTNGRKRKTDRPSYLINVSKGELAGLTLGINGLYKVDGKAQNSL